MPSHLLYLSSILLYSCSFSLSLYLPLFSPSVTLSNVPACFLVHFLYSSYHFSSLVPSLSLFTLLLLLLSSLFSVACTFSILCSWFLSSTLESGECWSLYEWGDHSRCSGQAARSSHHRLPYEPSSLWPHQTGVWGKGGSLRNAGKLVWLYKCNVMFANRTGIVFECTKLHHTFQ